MHAYIDESGNTGFNLFDPAQPYFLNVAMSSPVDFDAVFAERVAGIARSAGVTHLHANEMGVRGVEAVARSLIELVEFSQVQFYFGSVNKSDVAVMKFFDAVFDPGENPAAPIHVYGLRSLRLLLLLKFAAILESKDTELFWNAMISSQSPAREREAVAAIDNVCQRVSTLADARSRQLIGETLRWARDNIEKLSFWTPRKQTRYGHLPNLFAFPPLFDSISRAAKDWHCNVDAIVHDQQSQFGRTLREWHSLFESMEPERIVHFGDTPVQFADIRGSRFEIGDSRVSPGLQVVDVVLWTFARTISGKPLGPNATQLFGLCFSSKDVFYISLDWIVNELAYTTSTLMSRTVDADQLLGGMRLLHRAERLRLRRIREDAEMQGSHDQRPGSSE